MDECDELIPKWFEFCDRSVENSEGPFQPFVQRVLVCKAKLTLGGLFVSNPGQSASYPGTLLLKRKDPFAKMLEKPVRKLVVKAGCTAAPFGSLFCVCFFCPASGDTDLKPDSAGFREHRV